MGKAELSVGCTRLQQSCGTGMNCHRGVSSLSQEASEWEWDTPVGWYTEV